MLLEEGKNMNFGKKIQNLRKREGLTQEELAEKIGVSLDELASSGTTKNSNVNVASYIGLFFTDSF